MRGLAIQDLESIPSPISREQQRRGMSNGQTGCEVRELRAQLSIMQVKVWHLSAMDNVELEKIWVELSGWASFADEWTGTQLIVIIIARTRHQYEAISISKGYDITSELKVTSYDRHAVAKHGWGRYNHVWKWKWATSTIHLHLCRQVWDEADRIHIRIHQSHHVNFRSKVPS